MKDDRDFKYCFSAFFMSLALLMIFCDWLKSRIDGTIISLFVIAFLPWLTNYIKSLEAFGIKTELVSSEKKSEIEEKSEKLSNDKNKVVNSDLKIDNSKPKGSKENPLVFEDLDSIYESKDPIIKLALIRVQIEKELKNLCKKNRIFYSKQSIRSIVESLRKEKILKDNVCNLILDLLPILNRAVHSDISNIDIDDLQWVIDKGMTLLMYLEIIIKDPDAYWMISLDG